MTIDRRPSNVFPDGPLELAGYSAAAAVAAVLHNQRGRARPMTAKHVVSAHNISAHTSLGLTSALALLQNVLGTAPASGRNYPWEPGAPAGHYAVFSLGRPHALYSYRDAAGHFYLYDPVIQRDRQMNELSETGLMPLTAYLFREPETAPNR